MMEKKTKVIATFYLYKKNLHQPVNLSFFFKPLHKFKGLERFKYNPKENIVFVRTGKQNFDFDQSTLFC